MVQSPADADVSRSSRLRDNGAISSAFVSIEGVSPQAALLGLLAAVKSFYKSPIAFYSTSARHVRSTPLYQFICFEILACDVQIINKEGRHVREQWGDAGSTRRFVPMPSAKSQTSIEPAFVSVDESSLLIPTTPSKLA
jgi:hypothetical protein